MKAHYKKAAGGSTDPKGKMVAEPTPSKVYSGGESNVLKEAKERPNFKKGGACAPMKKDGGKAEGKKAALRMDRAPRKRGGRATGGPLSAAAHTANPPGRDLEG